MALNGIVTQEGISKSIDLANNQGFEITPYKFSVSEFIGAFDANRTINDLEATWYESTISAAIKIDDNTIQFNCSIPAGTSPVPRFTKEIYLIGTDGVDDFLLAFVQPTSELTYDPEGELRIRFQISCGDVDIANLYTFNYTQATEISDHNADSNAHPAIQEALNDFGIYVNNPNQFAGQFIDRFPVLGPSVTDRSAVYWSTITNRYEPALASDAIAKNAVGVYLASRNTVIFSGVIQFTNGSPAYTKVYLSTLAPGLLTLSPSDTIVGYTLPNNRLLIDIEVAVSVLEVIDPDGNKAVVLEPPLSRELVLQDADGVNWEVTIDDNGILSTDVSIKDPTPLFKITKPNLAFAEIRVETDGTLYIQFPPLDNSILADDFYYIQSPDGTYWKFTVNLSNQIVMSTFNNTYSIVADNGASLFDIEQTDQYKAVLGASLYQIAELPDPIVASGLPTKFAFADFGNSIIQPVYWDGLRWQVYGSGVIGDYKYSLLPEAAFQALNGSGWVLAKGQDISGSKFSALTGVNKLPDGRGVFVRSVIEIADRNFEPNDVDINNESIFLPAHEYSTGMRVGINSTGTIPAGLVSEVFTNTLGVVTENRYYYVIVVDADNIKLAASIANAYSGTAVNITSQGAGVHTIKQKVDPSIRYNKETGLADYSAGSYQQDAMRRMRDSIHFGLGVYNNDSIYNDGVSGGGVDGGGNVITRAELDTSRGHLTSMENRPQNISGYLYIKIN